MAIFTRFDDIPLFKYGLILADPPWHFENWGADDAPRSPAGHYRTMSIDQIQALPVRDLAGKDCTLVLWKHPSISPHSTQMVMNNWGFHYVTEGCWGKVTKSEPIRPHIGMGRVLRNAHETFYIGSVGKPKIEDRGIPSLILEPKTRHSAKPQGIYQTCDRLCQDGFKLDLFSRQERPGWDAFGDEVEPITEGE